MIRVEPLGRDGKQTVIRHQCLKPILLKHLACDRARRSPTRRDDVGVPQKRNDQLAAEEGTERWDRAADGDLHRDTGNGEILDRAQPGAEPTLVRLAALPKQCHGAFALSQPNCVGDSLLLHESGRFLAPAARQRDVLLFLL